MSKFIDDIIKDIQETPETWHKFSGGRFYETGLKKGRMFISDVGNGKMVSIAKVEVDGMALPTTWFDGYRIESAVNSWYKKASLKLILS